MGVMKRSETRCTILSCTFNHGDGGTVCDYAYYGHECSYTPKAREWHERGGLACFTHLNGNGRGPCSLTARVSAAQQAGGSMTPARARQLAMELESEKLRTGGTDATQESRVCAQI